MENDKTWYSIIELATMTRLSTKTIRNYQKMGLLRGEKVDGAWMFTGEEIGRFFQEQYVKDALEIKRNGQVLDYLNGCREHHRGCLMMDREFVTSDEVEQFVLEFTKKVNEINGREDGKVDFTFWMDEKSKIGRFTIIGYGKDLKALMNHFF